MNMIWEVVGKHKREYIILSNILIKQHVVAQKGYHVAGLEETPVSW